MPTSPRSRLLSLHRELDACRACSGVVGPVVHGPAVPSRIFLVGQAPGPREGLFGRPFAWTAGKILFGWFKRTIGVDEETFRQRVYIAAVLRCFPGKAAGGGDRRPDAEEIDRCRRFLRREIEILVPAVVLPVGTLAIEQVLGRKVPLAEVVGKQERLRYHGVEADVICLPHPSGASTWHRTQPGVRLLENALRLIADHPETRRAFSQESLPVPRAKHAFPR